MSICFSPGLCGKSQGSDLRQTRVKEGASSRPIALQATDRSPRQFTDIVQAQSRKEPEFNQFPELSVDRIEFFHGVIESEQLFAGLLLAAFGERHEDDIATALLRQRRTRRIDGDLPHGVGGTGKEMPPILDTQGLGA